MSKRQLTGTIFSNKMQKTVVVRVESVKEHPKYKKRFKVHKKYKVHYDKEHDRLMVAGKSDSDIMTGSVRILNVVLDFNTKNQVVNAELLHASEYLDSLSIDSEILNKITTGNLVFRQLRNGYEIIFVLKIKIWRHWLRIILSLKQQHHIFNSDVP